MLFIECVNVVDRGRELNHLIKIPIITIIKVKNFRLDGKIIEFSKIGIVHTMIAPIIIDVKDINIIGVETVSESFNNDIGL
jgi:hypothetical protein